MKLSLATPPANLPVTVEWAKAHSRALDIGEDALIELYIGSATAELDGPTGVVGRCFITQTWHLELSGWIGPVGLRVEPVQSVSVFYAGDDGQEHELPSSNYVLNTGVGMRPTLSWRGSMPLISDQPWPVRIEITAGRDEAMPDEKLAVLLRAAQLYLHREADVDGSSIAPNPAFDAIVTKLRRHL